MFKWKLLHPSICKVSTLTRYVTVGGKNSGKTKPVSETFKISITPNIDDQEWMKEDTTLQLQILQQALSPSQHLSHSTAI